MYPRPKIKMCGTRNIEDALQATKLGVDALGFIFAPKSPRYISPVEAIQIVKGLPPLIFKIGVFVDESIQEINEIIRFLGLNGVQLHGSESVDFCNDISKANPTCAIFKAIRVGEQSKPTDFSKFQNGVDGFVLDTYVKGVAGGTGKTFDWHIIPRMQITKPFLLAGGLEPANVEEAVTFVRPYGVDVNSGIEHSPGVKDHIKLAQFIDRVKFAELKSKEGTNEQ